MSGNAKVSLAGSGSAWMPFAVRSMKCPSASGYSARIIILLLGDFLRQLFSDNCPLPWYHTLRFGRDAYGSVRFCLAVGYLLGSNSVCVYGASQL